MDKKKTKSVNFKFYNPIFEYEKIFPDIDWPWAGHKYFAYDLVRNIKPKIIVELGTHKGTSFFSMCQAVKDEKINTKLYAIDSWEGDKHAGFYNKTVLYEVKRIKSKYYKELKIELIKKYFDDAKTNFKNNSIDILHIDGLHTYEAVEHDFNNWIIKVKKNGIIMFHDIAEKKEDFGVYKLWDKLKTKYTSLEFYHSHGLGVIFLKHPVSNTFCFPDIWSHYYDKVFDFNISQDTLAKVNLELQNKSIQLNTITLENQNLSKQIKEVNQLVSKYESENQNLNKQVEKINQIVSNYQSENQNLTKQIKDINQKISIYQNNLNVLTSSKYYKIWRLYCKFKDTIKK